MTAVKYCCTCRHYGDPGKGEPLCTHPSRLDRVSGRPTPCRLARESDQACGANARLFEAAPEAAETRFNTQWEAEKRLVLTEDSIALLDAICAIVSNAFAPGSGITAGPAIDERKALAAAGVTCLLEQAARALTRQAPAAPDQAEA